MPDEKPDDATALRDLLARALGRAREEDDDDDPRAGRAVPYDRFVKANERRKQAEASLGDLQSRIDKLETGYADRLKAIQTEAAGHVGAIAQRHAEDLQLVQLGVDDAGRAEMRRVLSLVPEGERPKSAVDWWTAQVEAHKAHVADKAKPAPQIPRTLQPYLPAVEAAEPEPQAKPAGLSGVRIGLSGVDRDAQPRNAGASAQEKIASAASPQEFFKLLESMRG